jgi:hypothetical protein
VFFTGGPKRRKEFSPEEARALAGRSKSPHWKKQEPSLKEAIFLAGRSKSSHWEKQEHSL